MPDSCCVVGCTNRRYKWCNLSFYRIPSGQSEEEIRRRQLWLAALKRHNWPDRMIRNARICGNHFISGKKSSDCTHPDYVPSLHLDMKNPANKFGKGGMTWSENGTATTSGHYNRVKKKCITRKVKVEDDQTAPDECEVPIVYLDNAEDSIAAAARNVHAIKVMKNNFKGDNREVFDQGELSGNNCENGGRESRRSTSSSYVSRKNQSLEALFQVTDTELKAISHQGPVIEHNYVTFDNQSETAIVVYSANEDSEELIGKTEDPEAPFNESAQYHSATESSAADYSPIIMEATPTWRQFKNIECFLQKAGIDTSSKTWLTLTRPGRYICPYCQRACSKPSVLEKHIRAHTGERPYPCLVCGFSFKTKSNFEKHCKSNSHKGKSSFEMKKMQSDDTGTEIEVMVEDVLTDGDVGKRKNELAQWSIIQKLTKHLEKDKCQRMSEVHIERQCAQLEHLKSMQENGVVEVKQEDAKVIHCQLSMPHHPNSDFEKIVPKVEFINLDSGTMGEVTDLSKVIVSGINQKLHSEPYSAEVKLEADYVASDSNLQMAWKNNTGFKTQSYFDQTETFNLPNPNFDPETTTTALQDLEELSDKFTTAATKDGIYLNVHNLPDNRVQESLQLKCNDHTWSENQMMQAISVSEPGSNSHSASTTPVVSRGDISSAYLKGRIQRLILTNAAVIDVTKVEPPHAKFIKRERKLSREDGDISQISSFMTVTSVPGFIFPTITSVPLQPLPVDKENNYRTIIETQSTNKVGQTLNANMETETHSVFNRSTGIRQSNSVIVEQMEDNGEHMMMFDPDKFNDSSMQKDRIKLMSNEATSDVRILSVLSNSSNLSQIWTSEAEKASETGSQITHSPLLLQSPVTTDHTKMLSIIKSNTVNHQAARKSLDNVQVSKEKKIKIEIKLPAQQQPHQEAASTFIPSKTRPILKHQGRLQKPTTTLPDVYPVFMLKNVSLKSSGGEIPATTEHAKFQVKLDSRKANNVTQTLPISVGQEKLASSVLSNSFNSEISLPQRNNVNANLTKDTRLLNEHKMKILPDDDLNDFTGSFICSSCGVAFETAEALDLHEMCYCTNRNDKIRMKKQAVATMALQMGDLSKEIITKPKPFQKSLTSLHLSSQTANTIQKVTSVKVNDDSSHVSGIIIKPNEVAKSSAETFIRPGVTAIKESDLSVTMHDKSVEGKQKMLPSVKQLKKKLVGLDDRVTDKAVKAMLKLKQHILKRNLKEQTVKKKLKRKLMMKSSLHLDNVPTEEKTSYSEIDLCTEPTPLKRSCLMHSLEDVDEGVAVKSTVFRRSEFVPELSKEKLMKIL